MTSLFIWRTGAPGPRRAALAALAAVGLAPVAVPLVSTGSTALAGERAGISTPVPLPPAAGHDVLPFSRAVAGRSSSSPAGPASTPPVPPTPSGLPAAAEPLSPYIPQTSCDYTAKPGVLAFQSVVQSTYPDTGSYGIVNTCLAEGMTSEHAEGRAWDWAVSVTNPQQVAEVNALFSWLFATDANGNSDAMIRRLGIMYIIWNKQIWGSYAAGSGWRPYSCSGVTGCHQDHVHFSFSWAGAWKATSYWSKNVAPVDYGPCIPAGQRYAPIYSGFNPNPCPPDVPPPAPTSDLQLMQQDQNLVVVQGDAGAPVAVIQRQVGVTADGQYGSVTAAAVSSYQRAHGLSPSGVVGASTWRAFIGSTPPPPPPPPPPVVGWADTPAPAEVATPAGTSLFVRTSTGGLARKDYASGSWGPWTAVSGVLIGAPAAASGPGGVSVAVRGSTSAVYLGTAVGSPWQNLGGVVTSSPSVSVGPYGAEIFVRGTDGGIWTRTSSPTSLWTPLGGASLSAPAAVVGSDGSAVVVTVGSNHVLYQNRRSGGRWSGWFPMGGVVSADPGLTLVPGTNQLLAVVRGNNAQAYAATGSLSSAAWSGWLALGGAMNSGPAATSSGPGRYSVAVVGTTGALYQRQATPAWGPWSAIP